MQIDSPDYGCLVDPRYCEWSEARGLTTERMLGDGIDLINQTFGNVPRLKVGMHLCKGNNSGMMLAEGGYDDIARELFSRLGISTQCGSASGAEDERFDERVQCAKLELVAELAQEVWGAAAA